MTHTHDALGLSPTAQAATRFRVLPPRRFWSRRHHGNGTTRVNLLSEQRRRQGSPEQRGERCEPERRRGVVAGEGATSALGRRRVGEAAVAVSDDLGEQVGPRGALWSRKRRFV